MLSANDVARRFTSEMNQTGICQAVVPVSGLLAMTARTLRQAEFVALQAGRLRQCRTQQGAAERGPLCAAGQPAAGRCGHPRQSAGAVRHVRHPDLDRDVGRGCRRCEWLANELLERSGLVALRNVIDQQFAQRSDMLKAHTALVSLRRFVEAHPVMATPYVIADIDPLLADTHGFEELRLLSQLSSRATTLNGEEVAALQRLVGVGHHCSQQAGPGSPGAPGQPQAVSRAAFDAVQRWRRRAEHPLNDPFTTSACRAAVRSAEAILAESRPG